MIRLKRLAEKVNGRLVGESNTAITGIAGIKEAKKGEITFLSNVSFQKYLRDTKASAIIVGEDIDIEPRSNLNLIIVKNPSLAYALVAELFNARVQNTGERSRLAFIAKGARISKSASIAPFAHIEDGVFIEKNVTIFPFVYIGKNSKIGSGTQIFSNVTIYDGVKIGKNVIIHSGTVIGSDGFAYIWDGSKHVKIPQLGTVEIEDDVEIGANVTIDGLHLKKP